MEKVFLPTTTYWSWTRAREKAGHRGSPLPGSDYQCDREAPCSPVLAEWPSVSTARGHPYSIRSWEGIGISDSDRSLVLETCSITHVSARMPTLGSNGTEYTMQIVPTAFVASIDYVCVLKMELP